MILFPAIDLYEGKAVRLYKGDYEKMTVYSDDPIKTALSFKEKGASHIHIVDLQGARDGLTPNFDLIVSIKKETGLFLEVGGGIRTMAQADACLSAGIDRLILGSAAVEDPAFLKEMIKKYKEKIAVGVDLKNGKIAIHGWKDTDEKDCDVFLKQLEEDGVQTIIVTDIDKDGAMNGMSHELYSRLQKDYHFDLIASGGVSSLEDIRRLKDMNVCGAIIGKALYNKAIDLEDAIREASC